MPGAQVGCQIKGCQNKAKVSLQLARLLPVAEAALTHCDPVETDCPVCYDEFEVGEAGLHFCLVPGGCGKGV